MFAVLSLSWAGAQSAVMQASAPDTGAAMAVCAGMAMMQPHAEHGAPADKTHKTCQICATAAHAPLCASDIPIPKSSSLAWITYAALRPLGPRGPPAVAPKARGPPRLR